MIGLVYSNDDNRIIARVENVKSYTANSIIGDEVVKGINLTQASICFVDDSSTLRANTFTEEDGVILGDILGEFVDVRNQKTELELLKDDFDIMYAQTLMLQGVLVSV